ncbi:MAG: hypothetical protein IPJ67_00455 [Candidatus Moraniibacteriota bacterium]|nr:MAG: hypothetical protein IPJ67_00455 [Candidatus Moranbacteria bacterium]
MFSFQSLQFLSLPKRLLLAFVVGIPLIVFLFFLARRGSPSSPTQDVAEGITPEYTMSLNPALSEPQDTTQSADSSALDSLQSGAPLGNIEQQSIDLDLLRKKVGKNVLSSTDVQQMELDRKVIQ